MNISHKKFFVDTVKIVARRKILTSWKNGKFLTKQAYQNWPRKKKKFNGLQFVKESEPEIKALLRKTPHPKTSLMNSTEHLIRNENMMSTIHHTFQKTEEEEYLSACFLRVVWPWHHGLRKALQKRDCRPTCLLSAGTDITDKTPTKAAIYEDSYLPWPDVS